MRTAVLALALLAIPAPSGKAAPGRAADQPGAWQALEKGLELGMFDGPPTSRGDGKIAVVRIDPARFDLRLLNSSAPGEGALLTARAWAYRAGASAAINASMFQDDYRTSVSLMRTRVHVNQRRVSKDKAVLAFDPLLPGVEPVRLVDRECDDLDSATRRYGTLVQSIRMISRDRRNVWSLSERRFSTAAVGIDGKGRVLFVHARTPWPVHELASALLALPLDVAGAMFVEGGAEAQLYARGGGREIERVGGFEGVARTGGAGQAWPVPNVIAAIRRK